MTIPLGNYAIVGASGMIGSHLLGKLADKPGVQVTAISHSRAPHIEASNVHPHSVDLRVPGSLGPLLEGVDFVVICAGILATAPVLAREPVAPVLDNLRIATSALEAAYRAGCRRCVWISSTTGYPPEDGTLTEDRMFDGDPPDNWFGIGWVTRFLEKQCQWYAEKLPKPMSAIVLRPSMVYGEYDHFDEETAHFLPSLIRRVVNRERPIEIWGTGEQTRDLIYAGDVVGVALSALSWRGEFAVFNVASGYSYSVNECVSSLIEIDGFRDAEIVHLYDRPTSISKRQFSNERACDQLGIEIGMPLTEGLKRTIAWYRDTVGSKR